MATVGIVDIGAALKRNTVVAGTVEMGGGVEVVDLLLTDTCNGVVVHLGEHVGILLTASDACGSDEMGVDGEPLGEEHLVAGTHYTTIVEVDVVDKEPRADAVLRELATFLGQLHDVLVEKQSHLVFRVGGEVVGRGVVEMTELPVTDFIKAALVELCLYTRHQIDP